MARHKAMSLIPVLTWFFFCTAHAQEVEKTSLPDGVKRTTWVWRNGFGKVTKKRVEDRREDCLVRREESSSRYRRDMLLETGTTIKEYDSNGKYTRHEYFHDEKYKSRWRREVTTYDLFPGGAVHKSHYVDTVHSAEGETVREETEIFYEDGRIRSHSRPVFHAGRLIGQQMLIYHYDKDNHYKGVESTITDENGNIVKKGVPYEEK